MKKLLSKCLVLLICCLYNNWLHAQTGDMDGDGVLDSDDLCPSVAGSKANKGCPDEKESQTKPISNKSLGFAFFSNAKDSVTVNLVFEKGPVQIAGIQIGDLLTSFNDINVVGKSNKTIVEIIKNLPDDNVKINFKRSNVEKEIRLNKAERSSYSNICLSGNCTNGKGIYQDIEGSIYDGDFKNELKSGKGKMNFASGVIYVGDWESNKMQGKGKLIFKSGNEYNGDLKNNMKEGTGTFKWVNGEVYNGQWVKDKRSGKGKQTYPDKVIYEGQWEHDEKNGYGKQTWPDGKSYEGDFKNNNYDGKGTYTYASGNKYVGEFKNNNIEGYGELKKLDGNVQKGNWINNVFQDNSVAKNNIDESDLPERGPYTLEEMNADAKMYSNKTAKKVEAIKKNAEGLKKSEPFSDEDINVFKKQNPNVGKTEIKLKEVKVEEENKLDKIIFKDNFENNKNNWAFTKLTTKDSAELKIEKKQLVVDGKLGNLTRDIITKIPIKNINLFDKSSFTINIDVTSNLKLGLYEKGIMIGALRNQKFDGYVITFNKNGRFRILKYINGKENTVQDFKKAISINTDNLFDKICIEKIKSTVNFKINEAIVYTFEYDENGFYEEEINTIGFRVRGVQKVIFSNLVITASDN